MPTHRVYQGPDFDPDTITRQKLEDAGFSTEDGERFYLPPFTYFILTGAVADRGRIIIQDVRHMGQLKGLYNQITGKHL